MTSYPYAYAIDIRDNATDLRRGVGLLVPSARYAALSTGRDEQPVARALSDDVWSAIDAWIAESNGHLPARPAPLSTAIAADLLAAADAEGVTARRFAAIPFDPRAGVSSVAADLLPELWRE
jgi:hypothetical protein